MRSTLVQLNELHPKLRLLEIGKVIDHNQQKWTTREKAIFIWQVVGNFYNELGYDEKTQNKAIIKSLKDILGLNDIDIAKLLIDGSIYIKDLESWLVKNKTLI